MRERSAILRQVRHAPEAVAERTRRIYRETLDRSARIVSGNFESLGVADLALLFALYDREFFDGLLGRWIEEDRAGPLRLRVSGRLTSNAGKTTRRRSRRRVGLRVVEEVEYEIAVSSLLLFQTFGGIDREVVVGGLVCRDRLEALQRIFEHELLHLAEFLSAGRSRCTAAPFHELSREIFGHAGVVHDLVTPREVAAKAHALRVGDRVAFDHEGMARVGVINRITKRATVLVEDHAGRLFSDGRRYATFYVPLPLLRKPG